VCRRSTLWCGNSPARLPHTVLTSWHCRLVAAVAATTCTSPAGQGVMGTQVGTDCAGVLSYLHTCVMICVWRDLLGAVCMLWRGRCMCVVQGGGLRLGQG